MQTWPRHFRKSWRGLIPRLFQCTRYFYRVSVKYWSYLIYTRIYHHLSVAVFTNYKAVTINGIVSSIYIIVLHLFISDRKGPRNNRVMLYGLTNSSNGNEFWQRESHESQFSLWNSFMQPLTQCNQHNKLNIKNKLEYLEKCGFRFNFRILGSSWKNLSIKLYKNSTNAFY